MAKNKGKHGYSMPMTLEKHFEKLRGLDGAPVKELYSLYELLKKRLKEKLLSSRGIFVNFSLHDASHSRSIIQAIERFLGEERICMLTPTDTFMLLICAYAHDYGMSQCYSKIYDILGSENFESFLKKSQKELSSFEKEDAQAIENLLGYLNQAKENNLPINDIYWSIAITVQLYLRRDHWRGIMDIDKNFQGLFEGHLKGRFISGSEGIVEICMCHGNEFKNIFELSSVADGIVGDDYHPRFIAAMLRLGDLLDLDNDRFPTWFAREAAKDQSLIPRLSILHFRKHEAISHLRITEKNISIVAKCNSNNDGYETANLVNQWTEGIREECNELRFYWDRISPAHFGRPPAEPDIKILVNGNPYHSIGKKMQMKMSQERVMNLLEGTSIYRDKYVGIREIIQNAVDASLLQLWIDIKQNVHAKHGISKNDTTEGLKLTDITAHGRNIIFADYDIMVEVIKDIQNNQIVITVKDKGIGISLDDIEYIAEIGSSKENNIRLSKIMENMPAWLKPSGVFGIGLQSVFQLTDSIEFYTRQPNQPERKITLYSYGKNKGQIDVCEVPPNEDGMFYDNTAQGTNVKIIIDPHKMIASGSTNKQGRHFLYYDTEFDFGEEIDIAYAELCQVCKERIKSVKCDYFNIIYQEITKDKNGYDDKGKKSYLRRSYFLPNINSTETPFGESIKPLIENRNDPYHFIDNAAYYWDEMACRCYYLKIRPCKIEYKDNYKQVFLPQTVQNLYHISYKFNEISNTETIYHPRNNYRTLHAGFLEWNILILDDNPTRYMNIDRDRLREDAIHEQELLEIRRPILRKWCEYFYKQSKKRQIKNHFENTPGTLLSLILLFYQNVSVEEFQRFICPYQEYLTSMKLVVGKEHIPITYFWDYEKTFQAELPPHQEFTAFESSVPDVEAEKINPETLSHFPQRLIQIRSIHNTTDGKFIYRLHIAPAQEPYAIEMSEAARLLDYMQVFDSYFDRLERINFSTIQKKIFKPDNRYPHLVISSYPHTFIRGRNFTSHLDCCIQWYILSPFSRETGNMLKKCVEEKKPITGELIDEIKCSIQFKKCVKYILKKRYIGSSNLEQIEQIIIQEYERFINGLCQCLYKNRELIKKQFQEDKKLL